MTTVLKIGGSVLTDKSSEKSLDDDAFHEAMETVSKHSEDLVLVHGAGSFGHPQAARIDLASGTRKSVHEVYSAVMELNSRVVSGLEERGVRTYPIHPSSCSYRENGIEMMTRQVEKALENGYKPVLHGDSVMSDDGIEVVSGDTVAMEVAEAVKAESLGMCTTEPGVLDQNGNTIDEIITAKDFPDLENGDSDVTGGIPGKVDRLLKAGRRSRIFGPEDLESFLKDGNPGTLIRPR